MKYLRLAQASVWVALGAVAGCGGQEDGSSSPLNDAGVLSGDSAQCADLSYDTFGQSFLDKYCVSCHGPTVQQKRIRLDTLAGLTANEKGAASEVSGGDMPPRGSTTPSTSERAMFVAWVECGAN